MPEGDSDQGDKDKNRITFDTQEDLDRHVARQLDKSLTDKLKEYGLTKLEDVRELQGARTELADLRKTQETDTQRLLREAREERDRHWEARLERAGTDRTRELERTLVKQEIELHAQRVGFRHPEDVVDKFKDHEDIVVDGDKVKGVKKLVEKLAEERPDWIGEAEDDRHTFRGAPPAGGGRRGQLRRVDFEDLKADERRRVIPARI
jgi:hypothetical protein